jgi:hypothetical protein
VASVGHKFAILRGFLPGDKEQAKEELDAMNPGQLTLQNRAESRMRARLKRKKNFKLGHRPTIRRAI